MTQIRNTEPDRRAGGDNVGAYSIGEKKRRAGWLFPLLGLLALLLLAFLLWLFLHNRGDGKKTVAAGTPTVAASASPTLPANPTPSDLPSAAAAGGATTGQLLAGGQSVLPLSGPTGLSRYLGQPAMATGVRVLSVPADEGFWIGTSTADRVWVQLTGAAGETPYQVKADDRVHFAGGKVVANDTGFAGRVGVSAAEGSAQLTAEKTHVAVPKSAVQLSK